MSTSSLIATYTRQPGGSGWVCALAIPPGFSAPAPENRKARHSRTATSSSTTAGCSGRDVAGGRLPGSVRAALLCGAILSFHFSLLYATTGICVARAASSGKISLGRAHKRWESVRKAKNRKAGSPWRTGFLGRVSSQTLCATTGSRWRSLSRPVRSPCRYRSRCRRPE